MNAHKKVRPEGPAVVRPGRQAGIEWQRERAPKARHEGILGAAPSVLFFISPHPGLTAGATYCRPFGPRSSCASNCDVLYSNR